MTSAEELIT